MLTIMLNEGDDIENKLKFNQAKSQQDLLNLIAMIANQKLWKTALTRCKIPKFPEPVF